MMLLNATSLASGKTYLSMNWSRFQTQRPQWLARLYSDVLRAG